MSDSFVSSNRLFHRVLLPLLAVIGLVAGGCVSDQQVIAQANDVHTQIEPTVIEDPQLASYVQAIGDRIVEGARTMRKEGKLSGAEDWMFEDVKFHLVGSPTMNAFTTGGKHVYLYSELFEKSDSEDAFAAVVGHEFGHIIGRHVQDSMNNQLIASLAAAGLVGGTALLSDDESRERNTAIAGAAAGAGGALGITYFGREKEREADDLGYAFYVRAGYEPEKFADFFQTMIDAHPEAANQGIAGFLSTHPALAERVETARERAANTPERATAQYNRPPVASPREFKELQQLSSTYTRAAAQAAQRGEATALTQALAILDAFPSCLAPEEAAADLKAGPGANAPAQRNARRRAR